MSGVVTGQPRLWLRLEGVAAFGLAVVAYAVAGRSWWLFAALFLLPDVSVLGYLVGPRAGAACYNLTHAYVLPVAAVAALYAAGASVALPSIWVARIAFDRVLGFGLKYDSGFGFTHLGRLNGGGGKATE